MKITLTDVGKRFNRDWIFRHLHVEFSSGQSIAVTGPNGSGKSTLLQVIAGAMESSEGKISYCDGPQSSVLPIPFEDIYQSVSIAAPYLELIEEMTFEEFLSFHLSFKPMLKGLDPHGAMELVGLGKSSHKQIRYYSSGMKQRVKLAQAFFSDTQVLFLDEPTTNLDAEGIALYLSLVRDYGKDRIIFVSSNDEQEYGFCTERINIVNFK
jgi:ABC-type multidrug transport system ATPase subunit